MELEINQQEAAIGDELVLRVVVEDGSPDSPPVITGAESFQLQQGGRSSNISIINGTYKKSVTISYYLIPEKEGDFTLSAKGTVSGTPLESNRVKIHITSAGSPSSGNDALSGAVFIKTSLSPETAFINQQVNYRFKLYTRLPLAEIGKLTLPPFDGCWVENAGEEKRYEEVLNGQRYIVYEINRAIFPQREGKLKFPPGRIRVKVQVSGQGHDPFSSLFNDPFFQNTPFGGSLFGGGRLISKTVVSRPLSLEVSELPELPASFKGASLPDAPLVGNFYLSASLSSNTLHIGDSTTLTYRLSGDGNLSSFQLPELHLDGVKIYRDKPTLSRNVQNGRIIFTKEFKLALIPQKRGTLSLQALRLPYFSIFDKKWRELKSKEFTLIVNGQAPAGTLPPASPPLQQEVRQQTGEKQESISIQNGVVQGEDIESLYIGKGIYAEGSVLGHARKISFAWGGVVVFWLSGVLFFFLRGRCDPHRRVKEQAFRRFLSDIEHDGDGGLADLSLSLKRYLARKTGEPVEAMTAQEIHSLLERYNVPEELQQKLKAFFIRCEEGIYAYAEEGGCNITSEKAKVKEMAHALNGVLS